ncbi:unnamed protein product [Anisakis simplex]|uniref:Secreted protein n=1 Tax=Anisakis simplex TaxID=6269 RepID=A0A0M3JA14_ANISI|nr:unnamed protein product [Anisakis simplex]
MKQINYCIGLILVIAIFARGSNQAMQSLVRDLPENDVSELAKRWGYYGSATDQPNVAKPWGGYGPYWKWDFRG